MILSDRPCKPYLDIEWKRENDATDPFEFMLTLIKDIILIFDQRYKTKITENDFYISKAHNDKKYSFHLTITTHDGQFLYKTNRQRQNQPAWDLQQALSELRPEIYENKIDSAVNSLDCEIRTIYSNKFNECRVLLPITINELKTNKRAKLVNSKNHFILIILLPILMIFQFNL